MGGGDEEERGRMEEEECGKERRVRQYAVKDDTFLSFFKG